MSLTDPGYLEEINREKSLNISTCRCSNCDPQAAARLIRLLPHTKANNLEQLISSSPTGPEDISLLHIPKTSTKRKITTSIPLVCKSNDPIRLNVPMIDLVVSIMGHFEALFHKIYPVDAQMMPHTLFNREDAWQIAKNYVSVSNGTFLREILGGQTLPGIFDMIINCIQSWLRSKSYIQHQSELEDLEIAKDQEILDTQLMEKEHHEEMRLKAVAKDIKAKEVANRKLLRAEKAAETARLKEKKIADKQKEISHSLSLLH
ncbi:hypothetical protein DFH28DRAFT_1196950 [Melampsora americana]|nr:hypothetical protein DFH28DRAFT_1196950 [Melampsora americana]